MHRINEICGFLHNYFEAETIEREFTIENGVLDLSDVGILDGQFFRIENSVLNDGIYQHPTEALKDEHFEGAVSLLRIPPEVLEIAEEVDRWVEKNAEALNSPYQSESFSGYSYSKASGSGQNRGSYSWRDVFGSRLSKYRKLP
jgi:hypothetical protein